MTETNNPKYPHYLGDLEKGTLVAIPEEFYELIGIIRETEMFGRESLEVNNGQMLYPSSATHCRVVPEQAIQPITAPDQLQPQNSNQSESTPGL